MPADCHRDSSSLGACPGSHKASSRPRRLAHQTSPHSLNPVTRDLDWLMLPDAYDGPASVHKLLILPPVPRDVGLKLGGPPCGVVLGKGAVCGAAMPEAAIDEDD